MNKIKQLFFVASLGVMSLVSASCSSDDEFVQEATDDKVMRTCKLVFEGEIEKFNDGGTRAAASWADNDTLFIVFDSGDKKVEGKGIYDVATGLWSFNYFGDIVDAADAACDVYHFKNVVSMDAANVKASFSAQTSIYGDSEATYSYSAASNEIKVKAHVKPLTGRLRFKGNPGTKFTLHGVERYISYMLSNGQFTTGCEPETMIVGSSGYTPYVYGVVTSTKRRIWAAYEDESYMTVCGGTILAAGKSGFMAAPTKENYNGWRQSLDKPFTVRGVCFLMKYVKGGTFTMGGTFEQGTDAQENEFPTHEVTLSDYYIAETETTSKLWYAVRRTNPSRYDDPNVEKPVLHNRWDECNVFAQQITFLTGENFSLSTEAQWEFAARGGTATNHHKYSGSDNPDEVAWRRANSYNSLDHQPVGNKMPNELGIYDMSGNAYEWCNDYYADYTAEAVENPTGPSSGGNHVIRGGNVNDQERVSWRSSNLPSNSIGCSFRLVLNPKSESAE